MATKPKATADTQPRLGKKPLSKEERQAGLREVFKKGKGEPTDAPLAAVTDLKQVEAAPSEPKPRPAAEPPRPQPVSAPPVSAAPAPTITQKVDTPPSQARPMPTPEPPKNIPSPPPQMPPQGAIPQQARQAVPTPAPQNLNNPPPAPTQPSAPPLPPQGLRLAAMDASDGPAKPRFRLPEGLGNTHFFLMILAALVFGALLWGFIGRLDITSMAQGVVIPSGQTKKIQHLEGGIVAEILVKEGDEVIKGQPIAVLEATASDADVQELLVRINSLRIDIIRLRAEIEGKPSLEVPTDLERDFPDMVAETRGLFESRVQRLGNELAAQREIINQRRQETNEVRSRLNNNLESIKLLEEQIAISTQLLEKDLTNRMLHLNLLKEESNLKGSVREDRAVLERSQAAIKEAQLKLESITNAFKEDARAQMDEKRSQLEEFSRRMTKFEDSLKRSTLRSPVDGIVQKLHVVTTGGVIPPGGDVAEIVPSDDRLVVEAKLPAQDIGFVHTGQIAKVKLASAEASRFDTLEGEVVSVSPDALETKEGMPYYRVLIQTNKDFFARGDQTYKLVPGVQLLCSIHTGTRSVMEYLFTPFLGAMTGAMEER